MFNDENPSYLGNSPTQTQDQPSYMDFPPPNTSGSLQPPITQPSLQNSTVDLPQIKSASQDLPYTYRAGVSPYFRNMPQQKVLGNLGNLTSSLFPITTGSEFRESAISGSFVLSGAVIGYYFENKIAKLIGSKGYGAIVGAILGSTVNNGLKVYGRTGNTLDSIQSVYGSIIPLLPLAIAGRMKKPMGGKTAYSIGALSIGYLLYQRYKEEQGQ